MNYSNVYLLPASMPCISIFCKSPNIFSFLMFSKPSLLLVSSRSFFSFLENIETNNPPSSSLMAAALFSMKIRKN